MVNVVPITDIIIAIKGKTIKYIRLKKLLSGTLLSLINENLYFIDNSLIITMIIKVNQIIILMVKENLKEAESNFLPLSNLSCAFLLPYHIDAKKDRKSPKVDQP